MRISATLFAAVILSASAGRALAKVHYVDVNSTNATPPYTNWATAATNIQDAVDAAVAGDEIVVTNGTYASGGRATAGDSITNRVAVDKPLTLRSVNGPGVTIIDGGDSVRCAYLTNHASLSGFTVTQGRAASSGGGIYCESADVVVSNCVLLANQVFLPALDVAGGGVSGGTLNDCILSNNVAMVDGSCPTANHWKSAGGGVAYCALNNCTLADNSARVYFPLGDSASAVGGGAYSCSLNHCALAGNSAQDAGGGAASCTLDNCILTANSAIYGGGAYSGTLNNCTLTGNSALWLEGSGGGAGFCTLDNCLLTANSAGDTGGGADYGTLNNCTLVGNSARWGAGASDATLNNCTLTGNSASDQGGGAGNCALDNCIVYFNSTPNGPNYTYTFSSALNYSCTTPQPTNGVGNITNSPLLVDQATGNLRLQSNSPCINAGLNAFAPAGSDLDGNPRIKGGTVDVGAYEFQAPASVISYAWLHQHALPADGSADFADPDGDGLNNWQEWRCGTDPTTALSALRLMPPVMASPNVTVTWRSVAGVNYLLERSANLTGSPTFSPVATGIPGQPGMTRFTDTNALGAGPWFYRVGVSAP